MSSLRGSSSVNRPLLEDGTSYHSASFTATLTNAITLLPAGSRVDTLSTDKLSE